MTKTKVLYSVTLALLIGLTACKSVSIDSRPSGANVKCDAEKIGTTPSKMEMHIFSGTKKIQVFKSGYEARTVKISFNSPKKINVSLKRQFNIKSVPNGAEILVDGAVIGNTPMAEVGIDDSGNTLLKVRKKGYLSATITPKTATATDISFVLDRDGSGRRLLNLVPSSNGVTVNISPVFSDTEVGESSPNVASVKRLTSQPQTEYIQNFSLLPDGKNLIVSIVEQTVKNKKISYRSNLWMLDTSIAGAPRRSATSGNYFDLTPNASHDGETLFFASTRNGKLAIWNLNMTTLSGLKLVTNGNTADYSPALHPNLSDLIYTAIIPESSNPSYLWSIPVKKRGMPGQLREGYSPQWRPDGRQLLYVTGDISKTKAKIWVVNPDGSHPTMLSTGSGKFNDIDPQWSVDGEKIVFASNRGTMNGRKNYDIWIMDADGGNLTQLTTNSSRDDRPVFSPDGKTIFFRSNRGLTWDIWVMKITN